MKDTFKLKVCVALMASCVVFPFLFHDKREAIRVVISTSPARLVPGLVQTLKALDDMTESFK